MKKPIRATRSAGFTFIDGLIVIATVVLAAIIAFSYVNRPRGCPINCTSRLKQVGLAMRMFSNDHGDKFPWQVSTNEGGTLELLNDVVAHYQAVSNEMVSPRPLRCETDTKRTVATTFSSLSRSSLSYFAGLDADESKPQTILSGDRNINGAVLSNGVSTLFAQSNQASWGPNLHKYAGNIGLGDGSVQKATSAGLNKQLSNAFLETAKSQFRLVIP